MSPERLDPDQRLLYDALSEIWDRNTVRIMATCAIFASLVVGATVGVLYGSRTALRQTAVVIRELEERTRLDRNLLLHTSEEQQRAATERAGLQRTVDRLRRDLVKSQFTLGLSKKAGH